jgi:hypothetical protein
MMTRDFMQRERKSLFRSITRQYTQEGYNIRESKRLAKREVDDIMSDRENFMDNLIRDTWEDIDE